ncbi:MAG TPA: hypothetical protein VIZ91_07425 [Solirubrobacterales bacterium]
MVGLDADPRRVEALAAGTSYIEDVSSERLAALDGQLIPTSRFPDLAPKPKERDVALHVSHGGTGA